MQEVIQQTHIRQTYSHTANVASETVHKNVFARFMEWSEAQEERRFFWITINFLGCIGMMLPATITAILLLANNDFTFWLLACIVNVPVLALNLAAQPTKITVPLLAFAVIANLGIILACAVEFFLH